MEGGEMGVNLAEFNRVERRRQAPERIRITRWTWTRRWGWRVLALVAINAALWAVGTDPRG